MPSYRKSRPRYWRRTGDILSDHIVCPACGENADSQKRDRGDIPRLVCQCDQNGSCFDYDGNNLVWRRSPCPHAKCEACGWTGTMRSKQFEQVYGPARCTVSENGWHDVSVTVYKNETPGPLTIELRCKQCGAVGHRTIPAITGIAWSLPEQEET